MSEIELKQIIQKYKRKSAAILMVVLLAAVWANWFLVNSTIDKRYELGLTYTSSESGFIWGALIFGLFTVLFLCFHFFEKTLVEISKKETN